MGEFDFLIESDIESVVGVTFNGRQEVIRKALSDDYRNIYPLARIRPEPENKYDKNAMAVDLLLDEEWRQIGYLRKGLEDVPSIEYVTVHSIGSANEILSVKLNVYRSKRKADTI